MVATFEAKRAAKSENRLLDDDATVAADGSKQLGVGSGAVIIVLKNEYGCVAGTVVRIVARGHSKKKWKVSNDRWVVKSHLGEGWRLATLDEIETNGVQH